MDITGCHITWQIATLFSETNQTYLEETEN